MPVAFMPQPLCKVCGWIVEDAGDKHPNTTKLYKQIKMVNQGYIPMTKIHKELAAKGRKVGYDAVRNHCLKHQDVPTSELRPPKGKGERADRVDKAEKVIAIEAAEKTIHHTEARSAIISDLKKKMDAGELKGATYTAILAALKQESDIEEKQKDRTHEMAKLFASYIANPLPENVYQDSIEGEAVESTDTTPSA